ncbi:pyridoxamine 5'-phosphate oxidase family protein [Mycobacterium sp. SMC-4]|uniref:pyridoxamine 5'-phosphate oxidase family protein n=1 Tax=Mycobacterium sp. SMC-4 TaxID=2857059 RepID=UPI0021B36A9C|nr:pyridoxamine 5'-phosphate oxidase family protein [Mycobacterium sp. SMC-4]UXA18094.1 pyridoxamine 5'-phosphate oxidase family protein [Mycobacterium sp. SMC-4]
MSRLTDDDLEFLRRPLYGFLSTAAGPRPPQPRPVWYEVTESGDIQLFSGPDTLRVRRVRRDPRASLVVTAPVGERERWVEVAGTATVAADDAPAVVKRLAARYWDLRDPTRAGDLADLLRQQWVRIIIHPETVRREAM